MGQALTNYMSCESNCDSTYCDIYLFLMRICVLRVPDIDYIFSKLLPLSLMRSNSPSTKKQDIYQWLSIRLLLSQHIIIVIIATYQKENLTGKI